MVKIPPIKMINISKCKVHPHNVKAHPDSQIKNLMKLIEWVGFKDPIVLDKDNTIRAGHARLIAAKKLGMTEVPYVLLEGLTKQQMNLFIYMDNKINESPWIDENVELLLKEIPMMDLEMFDINWDNIIPQEIIEEEPIPETPVEPKSKLGDIYELGNHRVLCGDCTKNKNIEKLVGGNKIDQLLTDPPYGVDYASKEEFLSKFSVGNKIKTPILNDAIEDYVEFFTSFLKIIPFGDYNTVYIFMSGKELHSVRIAFDNSDIKWGDYLIWLKNSIVLSRKDYNAKHEFIVFGWNKRHKFYGTSQSNTILEYNKRLVNDLHPTMKPVELICHLIKDGSLKGMNVYDPFLGSGSTLIACEQTNRVCYGMELDPGYVDVIVQRWENFTGKKAKKI